MIMSEPPFKRSRRNGKDALLMYQYIIYKGNVEIRCAQIPKFAENCLLIKSHIVGHLSVTTFLVLPLIVSFRNRVFSFLHFKSIHIISTRHGYQMDKMYEIIFQNTIFLD